VTNSPGNRSKFPTALVFALILLTIIAIHLPLLRLPYIWDEAGYYIPAARDLLLTGSVIPHSTPSNAHPPLVMAYLALCWKIFGYAPMVTRCAMLAVAAFSLLGLFRLAESVANFEVAVASTLCTALYSSFFTQSSLAHLDMAAAGLTFWGLQAYVKNRWGAAAFWFSLAALAKETAILAPLALLAWEFARPVIGRKSSGCAGSFSKPRESNSVLLLVPLVPLGLWYAYHFRQTGFVFGNPEFFRYNVQATVEPLRIFLALLIRIWQVLGYLNVYFLTLAGLLAMCLLPLHDEHGERPRIAVDVQFAFLAVIVAYVSAMAVVGGAELARYMLPVVPLAIMIWVSTLWRRVRFWRGVIAIVLIGFLAGLLTNPRYGISLEDNLAYRDYIVLHQHAEAFTEARYPMARVLTAWPASDELTHPYLGYLSRPMRVVRIDDFTIEQLMSAADIRTNFDLALVFSTKYEPANPMFANWRTLQEWKTRYFGFHRDIPPEAAARILGGRVVYSESRDGQWVGVIELEPGAVDARLTIAPSGGKSGF
jgi:hypothetical protein